MMEEVFKYKIISMKKILVVLSLFFCLGMNAQKDSIAVSQLNQLGVYYFDGDNLKQIPPLSPEVVKGGVSGGSFEFLGENSENIVGSTPEFYVFVPSKYSGQVNIKQFRILTLTPQKGIRKIKFMSASIFGAKTSAKYQTMETKKLSDECYKLYTNEPMEDGHYGVFYNVGGIPRKIYDFDIVTKQ